MKTDYEFISFLKKHQFAKTSVWKCFNNKHGEELGIVKWYPAWRQYCYFPTVQAVYSAGCLRDINDFISALKVEQHAGYDSPDTILELER